MLIQSLLILLTGCFISEVKGHGRLLEPPSRVSLWRFMEEPVNESFKEFDDNQYNCGGKSNQWEHNGGKCGICGDPFQGPREAEGDGKYANKIIVGRYTTGQIINVTVEITANHQGWFEFRLCPVDDGLKDATLGCLDENLLPLADGSGSRYLLPPGTGYKRLRLQLPADVTCSRCVLQWKYNAGNDWRCERPGGPCGLGYGPQEQFYGCADIAITASSGSASGGRGGSPTTTTPQPEITTTTIPRPETPKCRGAGNLSDSEEVAKQCVAACQTGCCPTQLCNDACRQ